MNPETEQLNKRIATLENQVNFIYRHLGVPLPSELTVEDDLRLIQLLKSGKTMEAIMLLRECKGMQLGDAKMEVESRQKELGIR